MSMIIRVLMSENRKSKNDRETELSGQGIGVDDLKAIGRLSNSNKQSRTVNNCCSGRVEVNLIPPIDVLAPQPQATPTQPHREAINATRLPHVGDFHKKRTYASST